MYFSKATPSLSNAYGDRTINSNNKNDKGSSILSERQSIINPNSTDIEIANALSILENMSDEEEDDEENVDSSWRSPTEMIKMDEDHGEYISDEYEGKVIHESLFSIH